MLTRPRSLEESLVASRESWSALEAMSARVLTYLFGCRLIRLVTGRHPRRS